VNVIFGAGPLGLAVARDLTARGRRVRVVCRSGRADVPAGVEVVGADATDPAAARRACQDSAVVYHCANAPYAQWVTKLPPIMAGIIEGAGAAGARLVYGDNLYMYGPTSGPITEDLPNRAPGPNGQVRATLAEALMDAHRSERVRATIGRASDFYGPHVVESTVGKRVFGAVLKGKTAQVLGNPDVPHSYTFIGDFARALVTLGDREDALGEIWHVPTAPALTTRQFVQMIFEEAGVPARMAAAPHWGIALLALFNPMMRAVREQLYQSEGPFVVDHGKFARAFGGQTTPHREAVRQTLEWYRKRIPAPA
jgi:nucleoside-diphosphate-sugar epimerase